MRAAYERCEPFLSTIPSKSVQDSRAQMARTMLLGLGYAEEELEKVDFEDLDMGTFQDLVNRKVGSISPKGKQQQLVGLEELPGYLAQGWTVVTALNGNQAVINPP
jgi:hypothetical protein